MSSMRRSLQLQQVDSTHPTARSTACGPCTDTASSNAPLCRYGRQQLCRFGSWPAAGGPPLFPAVLRRRPVGEDSNVNIGSFSAMEYILLHLSMISPLVRLECVRTLIEMNCMKISSATIVVAGLGPAESFLESPYFGRFFRAATDLATSFFSIL